MHAPSRSWPVSITAVLFVAGATALSTNADSIVVAGASVAVTVALFLTLLFGFEGVGMILLTICFLMAPFFRAFPIVSGTAISAVDPLILLSVGLLLPRILRGRLDVSPLYLVPAFSFVIVSYLAAFSSANATSTLNEITEWAFLALVLGLAFIALDLTRNEVAVLAIAYIAGQMISTAYALVNGPSVVNHRYEGLAAHPNYFGGGAMMAGCLLLYLYHDPRAKTVVMRLVWWGTMATCMWGIYVSGARGAAVGMAAVLVMVTVVERSGLYVFLATLGVVTGAVFLQPIADRAGEGSTLARLAGQDATGTLTTGFRLDEWHEALARIPESPILGQGLTLEVLSFHNNYLSIAVGVGLVALTAYLVVMWSMSRGLFGPSPERRLLYPVVAFAAWSLTQPGFKDRSNWMPLLLGLAVFHGYRVARGRWPTSTEDDGSSAPEPRRASSFPSAPNRTRGASDA